MMRLFGNKFCLFLLLFLILVATSYAETYYDEGAPLEPLVDEELVIDEELFLDDEEPAIDEELFLDEEPVITEEPDEELIHDEEPFIDEETVIVEEPLYDEYFFFFDAPSVILEVPVFQIRSFEDIFPDLSQTQRAMAMTTRGLRNSFRSYESPEFIPNPDLEIDLLGKIERINPSHIIETLLLVPHDGRELDLLDIFNALGRIERIKDHPARFNDRDIFIFTESSRIAGRNNRRDIPDPPPADMLPFSETIYLRLNEINYGNLFIRGDITISAYGITYYMTNFLDVRFFLLPVIRAGRFATILYLEPVKEGMLIYSVSGFFLPGIIANRLDLTPDINRRLDIFTSWIIEGLRETGNPEE